MSSGGTLAAGAFSWLSSRRVGGVGREAADGIRMFGMLGICAPAVTELRNECSICGGCDSGSVLCVMAAHAVVDTHFYVLGLKKTFGSANNGRCELGYSASCSCQRRSSVHSLDSHDEYF